MLPARGRTPRDKAPGESGGRVGARGSLARLRHPPVFRRADRHPALRSWVTELTPPPFKKLPGSRPQLFERLDRPGLNPLPGGSYEYAEWQTARGHRDYHVEVAGHYYSAPSPLVQHQVEGRRQAPGGAGCDKGPRGSRPRRSPPKGRHPTLPAPLPKAPRRARDGPPERLGRWAQPPGPAPAQVVAPILAARPPPPQGFRSGLGIRRLGKPAGPPRLAAACEPALPLAAGACRSIESLLKQGRDRQPLAPPRLSPPLPAHVNLRGPEYSH